MRLLCNGVALDLEAGATMSFKKVNPLFAFDKLTCERTQSFNLPATPTNDRVLDLAKIPAYYGAGMRRRFNAELQDGTVVKQGYLYVDKYGKGKYSAVFVTGELLGLLDIKQAGKLADITTSSEIEKYGGAALTPSAGISHIFANVQYKTDGEYISPSVSVSALSERVVLQNGLKPVTLPAEANGLRIIPSKPRAISLHETTLTVRIIDPQQPSETIPRVPFNTASIGGDASVLFRTISHVVATTRLNTQLYYRYLQVVPMQYIRIKIPQDWPSDRYIISFQEDEQDAVFLGDRAFQKVWSVDHATITRTGELLAGRTVEIAAGVPFSFVTEDEYECTRVYFQGYIYTIGWNFSAYQLPITLEGLDNIEPGDTVRLQDNLPDITYVELLKAISAMTGKALNYTEDGGITFETLNVYGWPIINITKPLGADEISRKFSDYAKRNVLRFNTDESVPESARISSAYVIDSDNLEEEKELQVIPFSEGGVVYDTSGIGLVMVPATNESDTVADANTTADYMQRATLPINSKLQEICDASTAITIRARMTLHEYEALAAKVTILYAGVLYVWTEATWRNGTATLQLSKIYA